MVEHLAVNERVAGSNPARGAKFSIMPQAIYKVPNGKLLKVFVEKEKKKILKISITGDFFVYPEEKIEELENVLIGEELDEEKLKLSIQTFINKEGVELFGVDTESLTKVILMCE